MFRRRFLALSAGLLALPLPQRQTAGLPSCVDSIPLGRESIRVSSLRNPQDGAWGKVSFELNDAFEVGEATVFLKVTASQRVHRDNRATTRSNSASLSGSRLPPVIQATAGTWQWTLRDPYFIPDDLAAALLSGQTMTVSAVIGGQTRSGRVRLNLPGFAGAWDRALERARALTRDQIANRCEASTCYLTTATVDAVGLTDDCWELRTLRAYRDEVLGRTARGAGIVAEYYRLAPALIERIQDRADARAIWLRTYATGILPSALAARLGLNDLALVLYRSMTRRLERLAA